MDDWDSSLSSNSSEEDDLIVPALEASDETPWAIYRRVQVNQNHEKTNERLLEDYFGQLVIIQTLLI